jgi:hypothetical protein
MKIKERKRMRIYLDRVREGREKRKGEEGESFL